MNKFSNENHKLQQDIKNILVDREILENRLSEGDNKYNYDVQGMAR